jgi:hypothetical protein
LLMDEKFSDGCQNKQAVRRGNCEDNLPGTSRLPHPLAPQQTRQEHCPQPHWAPEIIKMVAPSQ